jgi:arachidonate 5-lipoxygenase
MSESKPRERRTLPPSRFRLPQSCTSDRRRAREATLALQRTQYVFQEDAAPGHPDAGETKFLLPDGTAMLPPGEEFGPEKLIRLGLHKLVLQLRGPYIKYQLRGHHMKNEEDYVRAFGRLRDPAPVRSWKTDEEFARQRLAGVNPMAIRRCTELPNGALGEAVQSVLSAQHGTTLARAKDRLFCTDHRELLDPRIQAQVTRGATLTGPYSIFYVNDLGHLVPLAIELNSRTAPSYVVTPMHRRPEWLMARAHYQSADSHFHEGVYHLLETHMVSEVFKLASSRRLHPDHPLAQLLEPHFEWNLAIDHLARADMLAPGGPIDTAMAAGAGGTLDLARMHWSKFSFEERRFEADLSARGVEDTKVLPDYLYREDARRIHKAIGSYVESILRIWYRSDEDVVLDDELAAWSKELATHVKDFPAKIKTRRKLFDVITEVVFRASAQHSAVNNGQYDAYGFVPNSPSTVFAPPANPDGPGISEQDVFEALPPLKSALAQLGMCWVLSQPTHRSLFTSGESPAFTQESSLEAYERVQHFRSELRHISESIGRRNAGKTMPYTYLDPQNVGRSTGI